MSALVHVHAWDSNRRSVFKRKQNFYDQDEDDVEIKLKVTIKFLVRSDS